MGRNSCLVTYYVNRLNAVQQAFARRPEFYFIDEPKELHPFAVVAFNRLFGWYFFSHYSIIPIFYSYDLVI